MFGLSLSEKVVQGLLGLGLAALLFAATFFVGVREGKQTAELRFRQQVEKANADLKMELNTQEKELQLEYGMREVFRTKARNKIEERLKDYEEANVGSRSVPVIDDVGLQLVNDAIDCRKREGETADARAVRLLATLGKRGQNLGCSVDD